MKRILSTLFFLAFAVIVNAQYNRYVVTFTNKTIVGDSNIINGTVSRWTNSPLNTTAWLTTNSAAGSATNLQRFIARNYPALFASVTNATNVLIAGSGLTFGIEGGFGFVTTNSNTTTNWHALLLPWDVSPFATNRTNDANELVKGLNTYSSTQAFGTGTFVMRHFAARSNANIVAPIITAGMFTNSSGTFTGALWTAGAISGATITNAENLSGNVGKLTNGAFQAPMLTNASGTFTNTDITYPRLFNGTASKLAGTFEGPILKTIGVGASNVVLVTNVPDIDTDVEAVLRIDNGTTNNQSGSIIFARLGTPHWSIGSTTNTFYISGSVATLLELTETEVVISSASYPLRTVGALRPQGGITNAEHLGTNNWRGDIAYVRYDFSTLADGNNPGVVFGTNSYIRITGSATNAAINGIAGGRNGLSYVVQNDSGYTVTLSQDTSDPVPANRFSLYGGVSLQIPNGGFVVLRYDSSVSRWRVSDMYPQPSTATNVVGDYITLAGSSQSYFRGRLFYDTNNECLSFYNNDTNVTLNIGQEHWSRVVNHSGLTITNGSAVYFTGSTNGMPIVGLAVNTNITSSRVAGLATMNITNGGIGYVTELGEVNNLNTTNWTNGTKLFLSSVPGQLTNGVPNVGGQYFVGVVSTSNALTGSIEVEPTPPVPFIYSAALDFPNTAAQSSSDLTIAVPGATQESVVNLIGVPPAAATGGGSFFAFPSNNVVYIRFNNYTAGNINPASATFRVGVNQF